MAPIQMGCINIRGINRKFNHLKNFLAQDKISILAISETHTVKSIVVPKFHCYQRNSEINPTRSGGVALLVAQNLASTPHTLPNHLNHLEAVAANLHLQNMSILIISYYNRPQDRVSADLLRYAAQHNFAIVLGDFNARHTDFGDTQTNPNGRSLNSLIITLPLCRLHNTDPTFLSHTGCSISDHILSTENFVPFLYPHCSIGTTMALLPPPPAFIPITNFKQADWQKFQQLVSDNLPVIAPTVDFLTVDRQVAQFTEVLKTAQSQSVPRKFIPINKRPIPARILALIREKRRVYRSFIQTRDPALKTIFNRLNAQVRRDLNRFREEQWIDSCRLLDYRNGKKFWTQFQTLTGQKTTTVHHLVRNNAIINTPLEKANCFAETLEQIHQVPNDPHFDDAFFAQVIRSVNNFRRNPPNHPLRLLPEDDSLVVEVLPDEVEAHIRQLKSKKAPGPDELKAPIFKNLPRIAIVALTVIFNNCMRAHHFPPAWKHATTVMIPKPGKDPTNPLSYRPISLLNIAGKVFEKILSTRLKNFLEINNLLPPEQFGFRSERSTINPILEFHTDTTRHANLKEHTLAVFLDIERAFDRVWHDGLVQKLIKIPINPNFIQLIDSFLSNRTCSVKIQNIKSRPIALQAGVPQGSILSPLLYIVYCRDFPVTDAPRTKTRLFADDTAVWTSQRNPAIAARILQGHLNNITTWTNTWRIKPNPLKSQSILMSYSGARSRHQAPHLLLNNQAIPKLQHIRYLGVTFSKNCTLNQDVKETLKKSRNRANLLYRIRGRIRGCDSKTLYHTYKSYIRPVIEYRAPIYATLYPALLHQISACERRMLRRIFRLPDRFPSENLHQETNTIPIQSRLKELQSRYVTRTLNSNNALAIQTLSTSFKYPSRDGRLLNRIPKIPKRKLKHPPTALLSPAYTDLPDDLQELVDSTPLTMR
ncbi:hypothetical protein MTP99_014332 [Tenebrio molitor]|nr:hypothetical protein MTP99_014332 [Tenebrio molitor]